MGEQIVLSFLWGSETRRNYIYDWTIRSLWLNWITRLFCVVLKPFSSAEPNGDIQEKTKEKKTKSGSKVHQNNPNNQRSNSFSSAEPKLLFFWLFWNNNNTIKRGAAGLLETLLVPAMHY